jgi:hypothetical protein
VHGSAAGACLETEALDRAHARGRAGAQISVNVAEAQRLGPECTRGRGRQGEFEEGIWREREEILGYRTPDRQAAHEFVKMTACLSIGSMVRDNSESCQDERAHTRPRGSMESMVASLPIISHTSSCRCMYDIALASLKNGSRLSEQKETTALQMSDEASVGLRPDVWWK